MPVSNKELYLSCLILNTRLFVVDSTLMMWGVLHRSLKDHATSLFISFYLFCFFFGGCCFYKTSIQAVQPLNNNDNVSQWKLQNAIKQHWKFLTGKLQYRWNSNAFYEISNYHDMASLRYLSLAHKETSNENTYLADEKNIINHLKGSLYYLTIFICFKSWNNPFNFSNTSEDFSCNFIQMTTF